MTMRSLPAEFVALANAQCGMVARRQLGDVGITWSRAEAQIRAERWSEVTGMVLATCTGELTRDQRLWTAALHVGGDSLIGGYSALESHGLKNWHRDEITLLIDDEANYDPIDGVTYLRTRRPLHVWRASTALPLTRVEPAALLCAAYEPNWRTAQGLLAAVVQQRLTTAADLREQLERMKPLRRAPKFRILLDELDGGAGSLAEIDVTRMCRDHGLPRPHRQRRRKDAAGRMRYTDCEWDLPDGTVIVLEVDGSFHMEIEHWEDDIQRQRRLSQPGRLIVRCTSREVRDEPIQLAADLKALGLGVLCA